jgi:predicted outer membrane protein
MASSANDLRDAQIAAGGSTADITAKQESARSAFINAAEAAGMGTIEAGKLADKYGLVPHDVPTYVKAYNVEETKKSLQGLATPITVPLRPEYSETYFQGVLAQLSNRSVPVSLVPRSGVSLAP